MLKSVCAGYMNIRNDLIITYSKFLVLFEFYVSFDANKYSK